MTKIPKHNASSRAAINVTETLPTQIPETIVAQLSPPKRITKQAILIELMQRDGGASLVQLTDATGWLPHTARAAVSGLRKKGLKIINDKLDGMNMYAIVPK